MNRLIVMVAVFLSATLVGCGGVGSNGSTKEINVPTSEVFGNPSITRDIVLSVGQTLKLSMGANHSTPFRWTENPTLSNPSLLKQTSHEYMHQGGLPGSGGEEIWKFEALKPGTTTIVAEYKEITDDKRRACVFTANVTVH